MDPFDEHSPAPAVRFDAGGRVLHANAAAQAAFGLDEAGGCLHGLIPDAQYLNLESCIQEGAATEFCVRIKETPWHVVLKGVSGAAYGHAYA
jgi:PAS domain-containing protein